MKDISPILRSLGLVESEVRTYMTSLSLGPATVLDLAKLTRLSRQATYVAIDQLTERGLMSSVLRGKKRYYAAEHPQRLLAFAKKHEAEMAERVNDLERALPELELRVGGERPTVRYFEGKEALNIALEEQAASPGGMIYEIGDVEAFNQLSNHEYVKSLLEKAKKKNVNLTVHAIYWGAARGKTLKSERYFLSPEFGKFKSNIAVYEDKVVLTSLQGKIASIFVENREIADGLKVLFKLAFDEAKRRFPTG